MCNAMEKLTLEEFLTFPNSDLTSIKKLIKSKNWLNLGKNLNRKDLREWVYENEKTKNFLTCRNSKVDGETWTNIILDDIGGHNKMKKEILDLGFKIITQNQNELSKNTCFKNDTIELTLMQFRNLGDNEVFHLIAKMHST